MTKLNNHTAVCEFIPIFSSVVCKIIYAVLDCSVINKKVNMEPRQGVKE